MVGEYLIQEIQMSDITYQQEFLEEINKEELEELCKYHWKEIALYQDKVELNPDYEFYQQGSDSGNLRFFTVKDNGKLVGYMVFNVDFHLHYKDDLYAIADVLFLHPNYRKKLIGFEFINYCEKALKDANVSVVILNMKTSLPFDKLCESMGYDYVERIYSKYIKEEE